MTPEHLSVVVNVGRVGLVALALSFFTWFRTRAAAVELAAGLRRAWLAFRAPRPRETRSACPTCAGLSPLLCSVPPDPGEPITEAERRACSLWECHTHGCFDGNGVLYGQRRTCAKCGHRESPIGDESCHCVVNLPLPCCFVPGKPGEERRGVCTYTEPPSMRWSPESGA